MKMMPEFPFAVPDRLLSIADLLAEQGWAVAESGLAPEVLDQLERNCRALWQDEALRPAAVGRAGERQVVPEIRGDHIRWLDDCPPCAAQDAYVEAMARLRLTLNRTLLLGLDNYETHYALYPPGAGYSRHLDRLKDNPLRTVSVVLYLNSQWQPGDGGELRLHLPEGPVGGELPEPAVAAGGWRRAAPASAGGPCGCGAPRRHPGGVLERQYPPRGAAGPPSSGQSGRLVPPASGQPAAALTGGSASLQ